MAVYFQACSLLQSHALVDGHYSCCSKGTMYYKNEEIPSFSTIFMTQNSTWIHDKLLGHFIGGCDWGCAPI